MTTKTLDTLAQVVTAFMKRLPEMDDPDAPLNGSDAVDVLADYWPLFREVLKEQKARDRLAYKLAEALNFAYANEMERDDDARNVENDRLGDWEQLLAKSVTYWPRKGRR